MFKDRKRGGYFKNPKRIILISVEGKNKTEKIYFYNFQGKDKDYRIVFVPGNETDPVNLVKQAIKSIKTNNLSLEYDRVFCILDTDNDVNKITKIKEAIKLAEEKNVKLITSNPCIELWFLLHYNYFSKMMNSDDALKQLKKLNPKYDKNFNIYLDIKDKTLIAIKRAKKLEQQQRQNGSNELFTLNPQTEVYKIIEELQKNEK